MPTTPCHAEHGPPQCPLSTAPQRRTLRAHAMASGQQNWTTSSRFETGGSGPILKYTGSSFLVHQGHSFTLTDLPPAWCSSCGCLRESGSDQPLYRPKERKLALVVSVSAPFLLSKAEVAKRCLPGRMSAKARPIMWSDRLTAEVTCITAASIRVPWPYGRFLARVQGGGPDLRLLADGRGQCCRALSRRTWKVEPTSASGYPSWSGCR